MRKIREVLRLGLRQGRGRREIARSCGISPSTVTDYLRRAEEAGLTGEIVVELDDAALEAKLFPRRRPGASAPRPLPDWAGIHRELRAKGVTLQLLWQEYKATHPDGYELSQFYERYRRYKTKLDVVLRQDHKAGERMFVDYAGKTVPVFDRNTGEIREAEIFVAVLGASNYTYAEASWDQKLESWIASHIRAVEFFGGAADLTIVDNLHSAVTKACRYEPDLNPTYNDWARHYDTAILPARPRKPRDKAKVEAGVLVAERWILAALRRRTFFSLAELNRAIRELLDQLNDRPFQKLEGSRRSWFESIERSCLKPLPDTRYEIAYWKKAGVNIDYHVELDRHYYSVPYTLVKEKVWIRYTRTTVEILHRGRRVASDRRSYVPGKYTTVPEHMPKSHREHLEWTPSRIIAWGRKTGEATANVMQAILESRRHPEQGYRSCLGILRLGGSYAPERVEAACTRALAIGSASYKSVRSILESGLDRQALPKKTAPAQPIEHGNIRGNGYYR
jgi:transposase